MDINQSVQIKNFKTDKVFHLKPLLSNDKDASKLEQDIYNCCTEKLIYEVLFKDMYPDGYTLENAKGFIQYSNQGWAEKTHFIFGIFDTDNNSLVGAIDIKSANLDCAEVGYWLSTNYSGLMTNALKAIVDIARKNNYKSLEIFTELTNQKSENVVKRAGFEYIEEVLVKEIPNKRHLLNL